jgi:ribosomal peptide maturation radical SAM protein 1
MKRVALITMPFGTAMRPALGLSLLKAALARGGLPCEVLYLNLRFAKRVGNQRYERIANSNPEFLMGDWVFAADLFGDRIPPSERYFIEILQRSPSDTSEIEESTRWHVGPSADLLEAREHAQPFLDDCLNAVPWDEYAIAGFTTTFQQNVASLALARRLKERYPHLIIIFGGANCEGEMGVALHRLFPFVDHVCSGEGDLTFPLLVQRILKCQPIGDIPGIIQRVDRQTILPQVPRASAVNMDTLPIPDYHDFVDQRGAVTLDTTEGLYLLIETARGCWWGQKSHCTFCGLNGSTIQFRVKSAERAVAEFVHLTRRYRPREIAAVDNIIDMRYFRDVLPRLAQLNLETEFFYETKANLRKEQIQLLREAGVVRIQPGIESLNSNILRLMGKGVSALQNIQLLRWCAEYMVQPSWNLLAGFPGENPADYARQAEIVPLLTHLTPPMSTSPVRLDRFSPLFTNTEASGICNVRAARAYGFVYPFSSDNLSALAYYFAFDYTDGRNPARYIGELRRQVKTWTESASHSELISLATRDALMIWDTRPIAVQEKYRLRGLRRAVYEYCDRARTPAGIEAYLATLCTADTGDADLDTVLDELLEAKLILHEDGRYLSLAVAGDYQLRFLMRRFVQGLPSPADTQPTLRNLAALLMVNPSECVSVASSKGDSPRVVVE